jgi:hypothetical protein
MGVDVEEGKAFARRNPIMQTFRQVLFSKIVPNLNKLGLLSPRLRELYQELGVIHWEHYTDTASEELATEVEAENAEELATEVEAQNAEETPAGADV